MSKTQSPATIIASACAALAQVSQSLAAAVQMMQTETYGDPSPFAEAPKRRGRPPAAAKPAEPEKKAVQFTPAEIEKIKLLMSCNEPKESAMAKVFALRSAGKKTATVKVEEKKTATVKVAPKKKSIKMITREDVENDSYTLGEFRAHLKENGIEKGSDEFASLNTKFLELRKKFKDEIEEENSVGEPEEMDADDQLMGEFANEDGDFSFSE